MKLDTLNALYIDGIKDLYSAETQILKALPKMKDGARSPKLKEAFDARYSVVGDAYRATPSRPFLATYIAASAHLSKSAAVVASSG